MTLKEKITLLSKDCYLNFNKKISVKEKSPLYDIVRECHEHTMPNDFIFDRVDSLLSTALGYDFDNLDDLNNFLPEIVDGLVDIYTYDLIEWFNQFREYIDIAKDNGLLTNKTDIDRQMMIGQYCHIEKIANILFNTINDLDLD